LDAKKTCQKPKFNSQLIFGFIYFLKGNLGLARFSGRQSYIQVNEMLNRVIARWHGKSGYREVLTIAIPLILSTAAMSIQHFVDRIFLTWYSPEAIAAAMPAGILNFTILSLFIGTASYVSAFVAQYYGSKQYEKIGKAVWQGIYFSLIVIVVMLIFIPLSDPIFKLAGHSPEVMELESQYFTILCLGGFFPVVSSALSGFFSGLGSTWTVMWVNAVVTVINIILDYLLIFGNFGFPELGIKGAAIATVLAIAFGMILFFIMIFQKSYREKYGIIKGMPFDKELFQRLIRYGFPAGFQFFIDMLGFTLFLMLVGRYGKIELAATNIAFNINNLAFMPMIGLGIAVSVLVGQNLGDNKAEAAEYATWSAAHLSFIYMSLISVCYLVFPKVFLQPFGAVGDAKAFAQILDYGIILLRFVAFYSLFDAFLIIFSSAIKGAGDTKFVMKAIMIASWGLLVIPSYFAIVVFKWHLFVAWGIASVYIASLGLIFFLRFRNGSWKKMLVIERTAEQLPIAVENSLAIE